LEHYERNALAERIIPSELQQGKLAVVQASV
jgi:hypothetical protein